MTERDRWELEAPHGAVSVAEYLASFCEGDVLSTGDASTLRYAANIVTTAEVLTAAFTGLRTECQRLHAMSDDDPTKAAQVVKCLALLRQSLLDG